MKNHQNPYDPPVVEVKRIASRKPSPPSTGGGFFLAALLFAGCGGLAFMVGVGAAFHRAGNWANALAGGGILLLILGGVTNLIATILGLRFFCKIRSLRIWWLASLLATLGTLYGGWVALHL